MENYSIFKNYQFQGRSAVLSSLDWCARPLSRVFGGGKVYLDSQTSEQKASKTCRVAIVIFSCLFVVPAVVSIAAFAIKCVVVLATHDIRKIDKKSQECWANINQFNAHIEKGSFSEAIGAVAQHPSMMDRREIDEKYFKAVNDLIDSDADWVQVGAALRHLSSVDAKTLFNCAIERRLKIEKANKTFSLSLKDINDLIDRAFGVSERANYYERLLDKNGALAAKKDDGVNLPLKMVLAEQMIGLVIDQRMRKNNSEYRDTLISNHRIKITDQLFSLDSMDSFLRVKACISFKDEQKMKEIREAISQLQEIVVEAQEFKAILNKEANHVEQLCSIKSKVEMFEIIKEKIGKSGINKNDIDLYMEFFEKKIEEMSSMKEHENDKALLNIVLSVSCNLIDETMLEFKQSQEEQLKKLEELKAASQFLH